MQARKVAALSDIHGNIRALEAVLEEVEREQPDQIVFCGDIAAGPFPAAVLERIMQLGDRAQFVRGNGDREYVHAFDAQWPYDPQEQDAARRFAAWGAQRINRQQRDFLASFQDRVVLEIDGLGRVLFCHGSPYSEDIIMTKLTPEDDLRRLIAGVGEPVIVCGHTHHQFDRRVDGWRVLNAGSIGMPYEKQPGAYWTLLGPEVSFRRTAYAVALAVEEGLASGYPDPSYERLLLTPPDTDEIAAFFEGVAVQRGERG